MAKEADLILKVVTDVSAAKADVNKLIADLESREIRLGIGLSAGGGAPGNPATFSNIGGTSPVGETAAQRLDRFSTFSSSGASLAMQNGSPGALPGGIGGPTAEERLDRVGAAAVDYMARKAPVGGHGALPSFGGTDDGMPMSAERRMTYMAAEQYFGGVPVDAPLPAEARMGRAAPLSPIDIYDLAQSAQPVTGAAAYGLRPNGRRGYRTAEGMMPMAGPDAPSLEDVEGLLPAAGQSGGAGAAVLGGGLRGMLSRTTAVGLGLYAAGKIANAASAFGDVGRNPLGNSSSLATRQDLEWFQAATGFGQSLPILDGVTNFTDSTTSYLMGRGFQTTGSRLTRQATLQEVDSQTQGIDIANSFGQRNNAAGFNNPFARQLSRQAADEETEYSIRQNAALIDKKDPDGLNRSGRDALRAGLTRNRILNQAEDLRLDFESRQGSFLAGRAGVAAGQAASGQGLAASLTQNYAEKDDAIDRLEKSDRNYWQNVHSVEDRYAAQRTAIAGHFVIDNTRAGILGQGSANAANLGMSGYSVGAMREQANTQYAAAMTGFDWGVDGPSQQAAMLRFQGVSAQYLSGQRAANIAGARQGIGTFGRDAGTSLLYSDQPVSAALSDINTSFNQRTYGMDQTSPDYAEAAADRDRQTAGVRIPFEQQRKLVGIDQQYSRRAMFQQFNNNFVGAQSSQAAGGTLAEANRLFMAEMPGEAEMARRNGLLQQTLLGESYSRNVRATSVNLQNLRFDDSDRVDLNAVFGSIEKNKQEIRDAKLGTGLTAPGGSGGGAAGDGGYSGPSKSDWDQMLNAFASKIDQMINR